MQKLLIIVKTAKDNKTNKQARNKHPSNVSKIIKILKSFKTIKIAKNKIKNLQIKLQKKPKSSKKYNTQPNIDYNHSKLDTFASQTYQKCK